ncbi:hypothetical protein UFOVP1324_12 [uncultured Caudovirales phage]|uniref:Uncharacterized protein n=1 Tax=uncultured Caudovirales phage TaxID=2100421 RepID=A0A6J5S1A0_9CAUD|nr:hypothetical protein UFOVP1324_12 [uncultured Caudovirales phage]
MSQWNTNPIALTAGMVAGTAALLAAEPASGTMRVLRGIQSRSAGALELFFADAQATTAGAAGQGVPLAAGALMKFEGDIPFNGAIFLLGGTVAEYVVLIFG